MCRSWKHLLFFGVLAFLAATSIVVTANNEEESSQIVGEEAVVTLTGANFTSFIKKNEFTLVEFYAPWCGHCKKLAPEYEKAARQLKESGGIPLAKIDATKDEDLARKFDIGGYPTLKFFRKGIPEEYKGGRTFDAIVAWVELMTGPAVKVVADKAEAEAAAAKADTAFVGAFSAKDNEQYKLWHAVAEANRTLGTFIAYVDAAAANEARVYRKGKDVGLVHAIDKKEALETFCREEQFPYFGPIDGENYSDYFESGRELIWFASEKEDYDTNHAVISEVAKQFRSTYNFVWLDAEKFKDHAQSALGVKEFPSLVLQTKDGRFVYPYNKFDVKQIVTFLQNVASGKVEKFFMSDDIPPPSKEAVQVVVGKTFKSKVLQSDKDVLLEVYAPWCGHCKRFEPIYKEFAEKMATTNKNLLVAKLDGTTNESPLPNFQWKGFPTILFVKAGTDSPIVFDGDRTLEALSEFVEKHITPSLATGESVKTEL